MGSSRSGGGNYHKILFVCFSAGKIFFFHPDNNSKYYYIKQLILSSWEDIISNFSIIFYVGRWGAGPRAFWSSCFQLFFKSHDCFLLGILYEKKWIFYSLWCVGRIRLRFAITPGFGATFITDNLFARFGSSKNSLVLD